MESLHKFFEQRQADILVAGSILEKSYRDKSLSAWKEIPESALYTTLAAIVLVQLLVTSTTKRGRRVLYDTVETIIAIILIIFLLAIVFGLPLGECSLKKSLSSCTLKSELLSFLFCLT